MIQMTNAVYRKWRRAGIVMRVVRRWSRGVYVQIVEV